MNTIYVRKNSYADVHDLVGRTAPSAPSFSGKVFVCSLVPATIAPQFEFFSLLECFAATREKKNTEKQKKIGIELTIRRKTNRSLSIVYIYSFITCVP